MNQKPMSNEEVQALIAEENTIKVLTPREIDKVLSPLHSYLGTPIHDPEFLEITRELFE